MPKKNPAVRYLFGAPKVPPPLPKLVSPLLKAQFAMQMSEILTKAHVLSLYLPKSTLLLRSCTTELS